MKTDQTDFEFTVHGHTALPSRTGFNPSANFLTFLVLAFFPFMGGAAPGNSPPVHQEDGVGNAYGSYEVVGNGQYTDFITVRDFRYETVDMPGCLRVEPRGRFVQKEDFGFMDQCPGYCDALFHPS